MDDRPPRAAWPRRCAAARVRKRASAIASARCRRRTSALADGVDGRAVFIAGLLAGNAIWAEVPSPAARSLVIVGTRLQRVVRSRWHRPARPQPHRRRRRLVHRRRRSEAGADHQTGAACEQPRGHSRTARLSGRAASALVAARGSRRGHRRLLARSFAFRHHAAARCRARACRRLVLVPGAAAARRIPIRAVERRARHAGRRDGARQLRRSLDSERPLPPVPRAGRCSTRTAFPNRSCSSGLSRSRRRSARCSTRS